MPPPHPSPAAAPDADRWALDKATPARIVASWAYGAGRQLHRTLYDRGLLQRRRLGRPVICVGNLSVGGTGKTPFLIMMAGQLRARGRRPAVLSRGYGAEPPARTPRIVSDGQAFRAETERSGDEPALIARACPGVPVVIGASRYEAGCLAETEFDPDVFLLDDGFQHEALARDADLVLWDARDRPETQRLLPAGRLREPLSGLGRATAVILTHAEYLEAENAERSLAKIERELEHWAPKIPRFHAASRLTGWRRADAPEVGERRPLNELAADRAYLVSGLARPEGFERLVRAAGIEVAGHLRLPDHAPYDTARLESLASRAKQAGATRVVTTAKDAVKMEGLAGADGVTVVEMEMSIDEEAAWGAFLDGILAPRKQQEEQDHR
jgi:tetraacyldisaccharide 4'-kinase